MSHLEDDKDRKVAFGTGSFRCKHLPSCWFLFSSRKSILAADAVPSLASRQVLAGKFSATVLDSLGWAARFSYDKNC